MKDLYKDKVRFENMSSMDQKAFDQLFRDWYVILVSYATQFVPKQEAEDIVQDLFFKLWQYAPYIHVGESVAKYLYKATRNSCLNSIKHNSVRRKYHSYIKETILEEVSDVDYLSINELKNKIIGATRTLPESHRHAFEMNRFQNLTYKEIAELEGVSQKTIEYRISSALRHIRNHIKNLIK